MIGDSFRFRLSLWNVGVMAMVLLCAGLLLSYGIQTGMGAAVDRELMLRAQRFERGDPPRGAGGPGPGPGFFRPGDPQFPGDGGGPPGDAQGFPPGGGQGFRPEADPRFREFQDGEPPPARRWARDRQNAVQEGKAQGASDTWPSDVETQRAARFMRAHFIFAEQGLPVPPAAREPWDPDTVAAAMAGERRFSTVQQDGERLRVLSIPFVRDGKVEGVVQVARPMNELDRLRDGQFQILLMLCPIALVIAGAGAVFLTERALRPVREVTRAAEQISAEDLSRRLDVRGKDELAQLAHTFNGMIERLDAAFEQQRRFTADASHELRTPLARIKLTTSEALDGEHTPDEYRSALRVADRAADSMGRLVQQLLLLARGDGGQLKVRTEPVDLNYLLYDTAETFRRPESARVVAELTPEPLEVEADPEWIACILRNLVENAVRHTPAEGRVVLSAHAQNGCAYLQVTDTGEGIPPEHLPHLTERFYRVDASRTRARAASGGTGLGLAITRMLVDAHHGDLEIASQPGQGTQVTVRIPRHPSAT